MERVDVFYILKGDQYELKYEGKAAFVEKNRWNAFVREQHHDMSGVSLAGGIGVEREELERIIK